MSEPITPQLIKLGQRLSRNNIVRRVYLLFKILNGYDIKLQIRSIEGYLKTNLTYEQAETIAYSYERLTGISCKPEMLLFDKNALADKLIDLHMDYQKFLETTDSTILSFVEAYFRYLYYDLKVQNVTALLNSMQAFFKYAIGDFDKQQLKQHIVKIDLREKKATPIDSMYYRHDFLLLEEAFFKIYMKKYARMQKRDPSLKNSFTLNIEI